MKRKWILLLLMMFLLLPLLTSCSSTDAQSGVAWQYKGVTMNENDLTLRHYVWEMPRPPYGPWDKIQLHRYVKETTNANCIPGVPPADPRKVLFFNPGTWDRAVHATQDTATSQQWYFAAHGYDFYAIEFRTAFVNTLDYDQFATLGFGSALSGSADWSYDTFREDIKACVNFTKQISGADKIFMSGFSRGGTHNMAYARKYGTDLKGIISLDGGGLWRTADNPATQKTKAQFDAAVASFKAGTAAAPYNVILSDATGTERTRFSAQFPYSRNTVTRAPSNTISSLDTDVAFLKAYFTTAGYNPTDIPSAPQTLSDVMTYSYYWGWGKGKLTNLYGGFSTIDVMIKYQSLVSRWWPAIQNLEGSYLTGYATCPFLDYQINADNILPFLYFGSEFGCPAGSCLTPGTGGPMTKSTDVTKVYLQGYGHVDTIVGSKSETDVKAVELNWMNTRL
jgi:pimeloyl-ACP methyl ester carboxylesterase